MKWNGVMPAMTTAFNPDFSIDHAFVGRHAQWLIENGCKGIICLGSLAEAATLSFAEKVEVLRTVVKALNGSAPVVSAISALSTSEAVALAEAAHQEGCSGLMILPQYVYKGDWRENKAHIAAVLKATPLPGMLYNNPVAYGVDYLPEQIAEFAAEFSNFAAVKESSTDVRRVTAIRSLLGDRRVPNDRETRRDDSRACRSERIPRRTCDIPHCVGRTAVIHLLFTRHHGTKTI